MDIPISLPDVPMSLASWGSVDEHFDEIRQFVAATGDADGLTMTAISLLMSRDSAARALGVDLLGELLRLRLIDVSDFLEVTAGSVSDVDEDVRWAAAVSLRHGADVAIADALIKLAQDPDSDVRFQAVVGLPAACTGEDEIGDEVLEALIAAAQDSAPEVREWAIFGIAVQSDVDTPRIRQVLTAALDDWATAEDARAGLKRRGIPI